MFNAHPETGKRVVRRFLLFAQGMKLAGLLRETNFPVRIQFLGTLIAGIGQYLHLFGNHMAL